MTLDPMRASLSEREARVLVSEHAISAREVAVTVREKDFALRELALREQDLTFRATVDLGAMTDAQLREANERLVVAAIRAQTMKEAAEVAAGQLSHMASHDF